MLDFITITETENKSRKEIVVQPIFKYVIDSKDLMIRGKEFYAVWDESNHLWCKNMVRLYELVDKEIREHVRGMKEPGNGYVISPRYMCNSNNGLMDSFTRYVKRNEDHWRPLDQKPIFSNQETTHDDYASFKLPYSIDVPDLEEDHPYHKVMSTWFSSTERKKIEWAIGCIFCGDVKEVQKFIAMYGAPGTGKGSVIKMLHQLFKGYTSEMDAAALSSRGNQFALDAFANDPIVAIQADADMSHVSDNTKFNTVVSHEPMRVNEKFKSSYSKSINAFIFVGTNYPIRITEARSGLGRRLIDVSPTGDKIPRKDFDTAMSAISHSLGGIAKYCMKVYQEMGKTYYDSYTPIKMFGLTNDVYSFVSDNYFIFSDEPYITLEFAWARWKEYLENTNSDSSLKRRDLGNELQYYFKDYKERCVTDEGKRVRKAYFNFKKEMFDGSDDEFSEEHTLPYFLRLMHREASIIDGVLMDQPAQYANQQGTPEKKWSEVRTHLIDLDTSMLHYVKVPENHIVIDFDLKGPDGEKSLEMNLNAAKEWPPTYAETSKSGEGLHLHYIYAGDVSRLKPVYKDGIEVKVFRGNGSLRRKLTLCNDVEVATISSGLPLKDERVNDMVNFEAVKSEKGLRVFIANCLKKKHHGATAPEVNFIFDKLKETYESGLHYDVSNMYSDILQFAASSTNQSEKCIKQAKAMLPYLKSEEQSEAVEAKKDEIVFFDVEVFPNLFLVNWKVHKIPEVHRMINPSPGEIENLMKMKLVGFNCRRYDNHILYARMMGYSNKELFNLSNDIISNHTGFFGEAYNVSYTDVYDFAAEKQSLKKWEIELDIHHQELGLPWNQPVEESLWETVAQYCDNDVIATEAVFEHLQGDFIAREILAKIAGMSVNATTNTLTTRIIFGTNKKPVLNYRFLGDKPEGKSFTYKDVIPYAQGKADKPEGKPWFPGYIFDNGKSTYRGEEIGEGGRVYSEPGIYFHVDDEDVSSMHPHSAITEEYLGKEGTHRYKDIVDARVAIKHGDYNTARKMFDGKLTEYLTDPGTAKALSQALKIAINSVYGLTSAKFDNPFHDKRNIDNIVAKRGALFMTDLKNAVQAEGYTVVHIKTDSIKVANADEYIQTFIRKFGEAYGYTFETEEMFDRICLVNDAVYIAKTKDGKWTATGTQFAVPYVFKTLFSHEPIEFKDMCETRSVQTSIYLDMNESLGEDEHKYHFVGKIGLFCPIKPGCNGGILYREKDDKYYAVTGTKGYRWLESEMVKNLGKEKDIDISYYEKLVKDAKNTINKFGSYENFVA